MTDPRLQPGFIERGPSFSNALRVLAAGLSPQAAQNIQGRLATQDQFARDQSLKEESKANQINMLMLKSALSPDTPDDVRQELLSRISRADSALGGAFEGLDFGGGGGGDALEGSKVIDLPGQNKTVVLGRDNEILREFENTRTPEAPKDALTRLQIRRDGLSKMVREGSDPFKVGAAKQSLAEVNTQIEKINRGESGTFQAFQGLTPTGQVIDLLLDSKTGKLTTTDGKPAPNGTKLQRLPSGNGMSLELDNGVLRVATGGQSLPTIKERGIFGTEAINEERLALEARDLESVLRGEDVGFHGNLGDFLIDRTLGQVSDIFVNKQRQNNRFIMKSIREKALLLMTTDTRLNRTDRPIVSSMFPLDGFFESLGAAREKLLSFAQLMEDRSGFLAGKLDRKRIQDMTKQEIVDAFKAKKLDRTTAERALRFYHGVSRPVSGK